MKLMSGCACALVLESLCFLSDKGPIDRSGVSILGACSLWVLRKRLPRGCAQAASSWQEDPGREHGRWASPMVTGPRVRVDHRHQDAWRKACLHGAAQTAVGAPVWDVVRALGLDPITSPSSLGLSGPTSRMGPSPLMRGCCSKGLWFCCKVESAVHQRIDLAYMEN